MFIAPQDLNSAEKGDLVLAQLHPQWRFILIHLPLRIARKDSPLSGKVLQVLEKAPKAREVVGQLTVDNNKHSWVIDPSNKVQ